MKKRLLSLGLASILAVTLLASCGGSGGSSQAGSGAGSAAGSKAGGSGDGGTITVLASTDWVKDPEFDLADKFEEETGIAVDYQIVPADQYTNLLMTKLNSGECADIFMNQSGTFDIESQLQISKNAVDLTGEEWVTRFDEPVKEQVSVDGTVYGITIWDQADSYAFIYNKKIFEELGLQVPTSYEEFKTVCQKILDSGVTPVYECVADGWHHVLPFTEVAGAYNTANPNMEEELNNNKTTFAEHEIFTTVLEQYKEVVDLGYWGENYMSNEYNNLGASLASGEYAMAVNMMGRVELILEEDPSLSASDFGFFPYPYGDNKVIAETPCGPSKFIFSGSKNTENAKKYIEFLAQPENLQYMIDNEASFNSLPFSGLESSYSPEIQEAMAKYKDGKNTVYQQSLKYVNPQWMDIGKDLTSYRMGETDAAGVLESIDSRRADQAGAAKDANWG